MTAVNTVTAATRVKICGLCREADAEMVNRLRPDYVGLVFAANRRRTLTEEKAASISRMLAKEIVPVGVFLNQEIGLIASLVKAGIIRAVQLHGQEDESYLSALRALLPPDTPVIKAFPILSEHDITAALAFPSDYVLFDGKEAGSGQPFDHRLALRVARPFFLAGGLTPENVSAALACRPYAVDVSSGVENAKTGEKDFEKMKRFLDAVRKGSGTEKEITGAGGPGRHCGPRLYQSPAL